MMVLNPVTGLATAGVYPTALHCDGNPLPRDHATVGYGHVGRIRLELLGLAGSSVKRGMESPLRWICQSTRTIATTLRRRHHPVSHTKVAQLPPGARTMPPHTAIVKAAGTQTPGGGPRQASRAETSV